MKGIEKCRTEMIPPLERVTDFNYLQYHVQPRREPLKRSLRTEGNEYEETKRKIFTNFKSSRNLISLSPNIDCCLLDIGFFLLAFTP